MKGKNRSCNAKSASMGVAGSHRAALARLVPLAAFTFLGAGEA